MLRKFYESNGALRIFFSLLVTEQFVKQLLSAGKVFRIGHMGTQANIDLVTRGMRVLGVVLGELRGVPSA